MDPKGTTMVVATPASSAHSPASSNGAGTGGGPPEKRKPVRRDPEKRRQQNIQAQKKYREKLKKRLDQLETLAASVAESRGVGGGGVLLPDTPAPDPAPAPAPTTFTSTTTITSTTTPTTTSLPAVATATAPSPIDHLHHQNCRHHVRPTLSDHSDDSSIGFPDLSLSSSLPSPSEIALWDPTTPIDPTHLLHDAHKDDATDPQFWVDFVDCGCLWPHVQSSKTILKDHGDLKVLNTSPGLFPADPYINTIRVERLCIVQAIMSNSVHIGVTEDMLCGENAMSPFYRPSGETLDESATDGVVRTIQGIFKTLKQDVRPVREQIVTMHHPLIDVLPFPTLRKNLIRGKDSIDDDELLNDLLNGLVYWGGAGVGRRDRNSATGYLSSGTPWDCRSWEARTWFLQKYWALLGGEEGELVRQSEWWRDMRGDETDPWLCV